MTRATGAFLGAFILIGAWILLTWSGSRLSYLITPWSREVRAFVAFPLVLGSLAWGIFGFRWKATGLTGYEMRMREIDSPRKRRVQITGLVVGLLFLSGSLAWTSADLAACLAYVAPSQSFEESFVLLDVKPASRGWTLRLWDRRTQSESTLLVSPEVGSRLRSARSVCVQGRSSIFGSMVEAVDSVACRVPQ